MGSALLGDDAWVNLFSSGPLTENPNIDLSIRQTNFSTQLTSLDQLGQGRPVNSLGDIAAVEYVAADPEDLPDVDTDGDGIDDLIDEDDDNDGIHDAGELAMGTDSKTADTDGDGTDDHDEILAGTDPNDSSSVFKAGPISLNGEKMHIHCNSSENRTYSIWGSGDLTNESWTLIQSGIAETAPSNVYPADMNGEIYFYKIEVE